MRGRIEREGDVIENLAPGKTAGDALGIYGDRVILNQVRGAGEGCAARPARQFLLRSVSAAILPA
jgi:hypothetical protein